MRWPPVPGPCARWIQSDPPTLVQCCRKAICGPILFRFLTGREPDDGSATAEDTGGFAACGRRHVHAPDREQSVHGADDTARVSEPRPVSGFVLAVTRSGRRSPVRSAAQREPTRRRIAPMSIPSVDVEAPPRRCSGKSPAPSTPMAADTVGPASSTLDVKAPGDAPAPSRRGTPVRLLCGGDGRRNLPHGEAQLFVAALGASSYTYVEATWS